MRVPRIVTPRNFGEVGSRSADMQSCCVVVGQLVGNELHVDGRQPTRTQPQVLTRWSNDPEPERRPRRRRRHVTKPDVDLISHFRCRRREHRHHGRPFTRPEERSNVGRVRVCGLRLGGVAVGDVVEARWHDSGKQVGTGRPAEHGRRRVHDGRVDDGCRRVRVGRRGGRWLVGRQVKNAAGQQAGTQLLESDERFGEGVGGADPHGDAIAREHPERCCVVVQRHRGVLGRWWRRIHVL